MIGNTLTLRFRFYHPYTLAPQMNRLDDKTQKTTFVCSVYARFEELARFEAVFKPLSVKTGLDFAQVATRCFDPRYGPLK